MVSCRLLAVNVPRGRSCEAMVVLMYMFCKVTKVWSCNTWHDVWWVDEAELCLARIVGGLGGLVECIDDD